MSAPSLPPIIKLVGETEEYLYQLGLKDRERHNLTINHLMGLLQLPWEKLDALSLKTISLLLKKNIKTSEEYLKKVDAYAQGLGEVELKKNFLSLSSTERVRLCYLIPELMSSLHRWIPSLKPAIMGCSSYFALHSQTGKLMHGRILDFPLVGTFDECQRFLLSAGSKGSKHKVLSMGSIGFCFHGITAMNSAGLSLALHQKFTPEFNPEGISIFEIAEEILMNCQSLEEVLTLADRIKPHTRWGLYIGLPQTEMGKGEVLELDITPEGPIHKIHSLGADDILAFHNKALEVESNTQQETTPFGIDSYNKMRSFHSKRKCLRIKKKMETLKQGLDEIHFLKEISTLEKMEHEKEQKQNYRIDALTLSSLQVSVMTPGLGKWTGNLGESPQIFTGQLFEVVDAWGETSILHKKSPHKMSTETQLRHKGLRAMALCQSALEQNEGHEAYHQIQMAISFLKLAKAPEIHYAEFFFLALQFIHEKSEKGRYTLLKKLREILPNLPTYLQDHAKLFIFRLEKILDLPSSIAAHHLQTKALQQVYLQEKSLPPTLFFTVITSLMSLRLDIGDIIYPHFRPPTKKP